METNYGFFVGVIVAAGDMELKNTFMSIIIHNTAKRGLHTRLHNNASVFEEMILWNI